jgi:hypothetical protein
MNLMKEPHNRRNGQNHDCKKSSPNSKNILSRLNKQERAFISRLITRDPLSNLYSWSLLVYLLVSILFLLWPYDLALLQKRNAANFSWGKLLPWKCVLLMLSNS